MYDFYFGDREAIRRDPREFLIALKHTLPRWANSLPDSEYLILIDLIESEVASNCPVFVETGVGATSLLFIYFAMMRGGRVISWDTNSAKASFVRAVCADAIEPVTGAAVSSHWIFISSMSLARYTGMEILRELTDRIDATHHDSDHTWQTISGEIIATLPLLVDGALVCVDDANQTLLHTYEPIINVTRRKIGLPAIPPIEGNQCQPHFQRIPDLLSEQFAEVSSMTNNFAKMLERDLFYEWYSVDRKHMNEVGMERLDSLSERFGVWKVSQRVSGTTNVSH